jgi:DNA-binding CsgD family transcriptional regulator
VTPPTASFIGRSADRARLEAVLPRLHQGLSAALIVSGDAGIGKTQLLQQLLQRATDLQTITISGYEAEVRLGFAALHRFLAAQLDRLDQLPAPQRDALAIAFGLASGRAPDRFLVGLASMTLLEQAARERPLLCVIDDVQWVDQDSLDTLAFVARRLDAEGVGMVFGLRDSGQTPSGLVGIPQHRLAPMLDQDMRSMLSQATPISPTPDVTARLINESDGNPLALLEYVGSLSPEQLAGVGALPPALPVGERLTAVFSQQIEGLPGSTRQLLLVLAAAGVDEVEVVSEACARLGIGPDAIEAAVRTSVVETQPFLAFRHPLIRSVVYEGAGPEQLQSVHAALAEVAEELGLDDTAAWHLACATSGPDEHLAARLERAAARARDRGGYAAQATLLTLAARRTIEGSDGYVRRLLAAAHTHVIAGNGQEAVQLLEGWKLSGSAGAQLEAQRVEAFLEAHNYRGGQEANMLLSAANRLPPQELDLARKLLQGALLAALETRERTLAVTLWEVATELLRNPLPPGREPTDMDRLHDALAVRCVAGYRSAAPLLRETLQDLQRSSITSENSVPFLTWLAMEDLWDDEFASTTWATMTAADQAKGAWERAWIGLGSSGTTEARHGNFQVAQELFDEATSLCVSIGGSSQQMWAVLAEFGAWRGREAQTRAMAASMIDDWSEQRWYGSMANFARMALTVLELSLGHYADALEQASHVARSDPPGHGSRVLPDLVEAAVRTGDQRTAREALDELTLRATAAGTPWALGVLARSRALVLGTSAAAEREYEVALRLLGETPLKTESARTQLVYGEWLRRRKRRKDAREQLTLARNAFADMGARTFTRRATGELVATGLTPTATPAAEPSVLTPQEQRVAERAAQGMTNAEISEELFLSASTVDYHLSKVFRKLEITSRRRIKDKLAG